MRASDVALALLGLGVPHGGHRSPLLPPQGGVVVPPLHGYPSALDMPYRVRSPGTICEGKWDSCLIFPLPLL